MLAAVGNDVSGKPSEIPTSERSRKAITHTTPALVTALGQKSLTLGNHIFIRIFKQSSELEVWLQQGETYTLFKTYEICTYSGNLGPKTRSGDRQAPEGFYFVTPTQLNPWSQYHLSFNLGYPNAYDRAHAYTGSALMIHGRCVSIGCYAMTDAYINEIYTLAHAAFENGQPFFRVHIFPFRMDANRLERFKRNRWYSFWRNLKEGYDYFLQHGQPPNVTVVNRRYHFGPP